MRFTTKFCLLASLPFFISANSHAAWHFDSFQGAVFTQTNDSSDNEILMYGRDARGDLQFIQAYSTGGTGTSSGLGNQGSVILTHQNRWLLATNAGSHELSVFAITDSGLKLIDKIASGGDRPISVTAFDNIVYVLNADSDNITGFTLSSKGQLSPIADSTQSLSISGTNPAQIQFSPWGDVLVVTEKATNSITTFALQDDHTLSLATVNPSVGNTPFGFDFDRRGHLIVSEAAGGATDASSVSSYSVENDNMLGVISGAVPTTETAACWLVVSPNGRYAYTTNAGSSSISGYRIQGDGSLWPVDTDGVTGSTGDGTNPLDMAMSHNGRNLYTISPATQSIVGFRTSKQGSLRFQGSYNTQHTTINGLAAF